MIAIIANSNYRYTAESC